MCPLLVASLVLLLCVAVADRPSASHGGHALSTEVNPGQRHSAQDAPAKSVEKAPLVAANLVAAAAALVGQTQGIKVAHQGEVENVLEVSSSGAATTGARTGVRESKRSQKADATKSAGSSLKDGASSGASAGTAKADKLANVNGVSVSEADASPASVAGQREKRNVEEVSSFAMVAHPILLLLTYVFDWFGQSMWVVFAFILALPPSVAGYMIYSKNRGIKDAGGQVTFNFLSIILCGMGCCCTICWPVDEVPRYNRGRPGVFQETWAPKKSHHDDIVNYACRPL